MPHHVTQRGNRRMQTFFSEDDYRCYLSFISERCRAFEVAIWAYCLMPNHVHLILVPESPEGLWHVVGETHRRYTRHINLREQWQGHLWQDRFASFVLDEPHLLAATRYIELNPVRAGLVKRPEDYPWSSARAHLKGRCDGIVQMEPLRSLVDDWAGLLALDLEEAEVAALRRHERTGRPLGSADFLENLEARLDRPLRKQKPGPKGPRKP